MADSQTRRPPPASWLPRSPAAPPPSSPEPVAADEPASSSAPRTAQLVIRLTPAERDRWHAAAKDAGRGRTASWVRDVVNRRIDRRADPSLPSDPKQAHEVVMRRAGNVELSRIGNNLNQLARSLHIAARLGAPVEVADVVDRVELLRSEVAALHATMRTLDERSSS